MAALSPAARLLAWCAAGIALAVTFFGYFFVPFDQGHGWGYRYIHSAWFVIPVFASIALPGFTLRTWCRTIPFLRGPRIVMVQDKRKNVAQLMARHFPAHVKSAEGAWRELWTAAQAASPK